MTIQIAVRLNDHIGAFIDEQVSPVPRQAAPPWSHEPWNTNGGGRRPLATRVSTQQPPMASTA